MEEFLVPLTFAGSMTFVLIALTWRVFNRETKSEVKRSKFRGTWKSVIYNDEASLGNVFGTIKLELFRLDEDVKALVKLTYDEKSTFKPNESVFVEFEGFAKSKNKTFVFRQEPFENDQYFTMSLFSDADEAIITSVGPYDFLEVKFDTSTKEKS